LTWQVRKTRFAALTDRAAWRRLVRGIALLFLLTHQAWAGIICHCEPDDAAQMAHACCLAAQHSDPAVNNEPANEAVHSPAACAEKGAPGTDNRPSDDQLCTTPQIATACCHAAPSAEVQGITTPSKNTESVVSTQPLVNLDAQAVSAALYQQNSHQPHRTRPLYLSFSCFLI
jgi:hypothetical protein